MTDTDEVGQEPDAANGRAEPSFLASFSQDDLRLLVMTFVGTLAANVVTVAVVAVALLSRPLIHPSSLRYEPLGFAAVAVFVAFLLAALITLVRKKTWRIDARTGQKASRAYVIVAISTMSGLGILSLVLLLAMLGYAAGVK
jgi:hypothetical protein